MGIFSAFILQTCFQTGWRTVGTPSRHLLFSGDFCGSPDKDRTGFRIVIILNEYPGMVFSNRSVMFADNSIPEKLFADSKFFRLSGQAVSRKRRRSAVFSRNIRTVCLRANTGRFTTDRSSARRTAGRLEMSLKQIYFESEDAFFFPTERAAERIAERVAVSFA